MSDKPEGVPLELRAGGTLIIDDGLDHTAEIVWGMNSRRRISEGKFELAPARPQVVRPTIKHKRKGKK